MSFLSNKITLSGVGVLVLLFLIGTSSGDSVSEENTVPYSRQETTAITITPNTTDETNIGIPEENLSADVIEASEGTKTSEVAGTQSLGQEIATEVSIPELYSVIKVVDGDTLAIQMDGQSQTIRLIGIDTPETVHPSKPVECFGLEASNKAKDVLTGAQVSIETDSTQGTYDKYNRLLAYVLLEDGTNFNKLMIEQGYGYEYTYSLPYKYQSEFKLAQQRAETNKRGLWADGACEEEAVIIPAEEIQSSSQGENTSNYICSYNAYNCTDFSTHDEAQTVYELCGGVSNDIHRFDRDKDGLACESLP